MKVDVVNNSKNWSSLFSGKKLVKALDAFDAKILWIQIVWVDTLKASSSGYDGSDNFQHHDFIQVLNLVRTYHFDDAYACFTKDADSHSFCNIPFFHK